jgi:ethanolamine utilization microcompartment shell protein EutS
MHDMSASSVSHTGSLSLLTFLPSLACASAHTAALTSVALRIAWIDENSGRVPCAGNTALA